MKSVELIDSIKPCEWKGSPSKIQSPNPFFSRSQTPRSQTPRSQTPRSQTLFGNAGFDALHRTITMGILTLVPTRRCHCH